MISTFFSNSQSKDIGQYQQNQKGSLQKGQKCQSERTQVIHNTKKSNKVQEGTDPQKIHTQLNNKNDDFSEQRIAQMFVITQIMQTVENNNTRASKYLLFHVPYTLCIAALLQIHQKPRNLLAFEILKQELRYIHQLLIKQSGQIDEDYVKTIMGEIICFDRVPKLHFLKRLGKFLEDFKAKMSTFMPYYYHIFLFIVESEGIKSMVSIQDKYRTKVKEIRSRYHNFDIC